MITRLLKAPGDEWVEFDCEHGRDVPSAANLAEFDGVVISGAKHDAHADVPWIKALASLVAERVKGGGRTIGICFGAQLLAHALGGKTGPAGYWELGARELAFADGSKRVVFEIHRDAVSTLPPGAESIASSEKCANEIWSLGDHALAIQGHPEMDVAILRDYLDGNRADPLDCDFEERAFAIRTLDEVPYRREDHDAFVLLCNKYLKGQR
ncbi:class I glutamine amidotransferase-like protein [Pelagophyceae sp. CCMP2097]|nr:class I glutamine amidotransferase-like protein [Pelagophyceae sp. CCMP2097]